MIFVLEWCGKLAIPLYPRATKADTFNNNCGYPELSKDWDWINQEFPLVEGLDLSTFTAEAECLPYNCMEQLNPPL
jgi:hypothetical protein